MNIAERNAIERATRHLSEAEADLRFARFDADSARAAAVREAVEVALAVAADKGRVPMAIPIERVCSGCSHQKHIALRCPEAPLFTRERTCGCDLHFGLWPDEAGYVAP